MNVFEGVGQALAVPQGRFVELPGRGRTFVRELAGPQGAPVVVLLHGWSATAALNWSLSFFPLATRFRVIAIDHRGHGRRITRVPLKAFDRDWTTVCIADQPKDNLELAFFAITGVPKLG